MVGFNFSLDTLCGLHGEGKTLIRVLYWYLHYNNVSAKQEAAHISTLEDMHMANLLDT